MKQGLQLPVLRSVGGRKGSGRGTGRVPGGGAAALTSRGLGRGRGMAGSALAAVRNSVTRICALAVAFPLGEAWNKADWGWFSLGQRLGWCHIVASVPSRPDPGAGKGVLPTLQVISPPIKDYRLHLLSSTSFAFLLSIYLGCVSFVAGSSCAIR